MIIIFKEFLSLPILFLFFILVSTNDSTLHGNFLRRTSRSLGDIIKQLLGRRNHTIRTGFQGIAQTFHPYNAEATSFFPSYYLNPFSGILRFPISSYENLNGFVPFYTTGGAYTPAASSYIPSLAISNPEIQSLIDRYLRGITSNKDDQETSGSSIEQVKTIAPPSLLGLKRFYPLPFYFFNENPDLRAYNIPFPYLRKFIRRNSHDPKNDNFNRYIQLIQQHALPISYYPGLIKNNMKLSEPQFYFNHYSNDKSLQSPSQGSSKSMNPESTSSTPESNKEIKLQPTYYYNPPSSYSLSLEPNKISNHHDKSHSDKLSNEE